MKRSKRNKKTFKLSRANQQYLGVLQFFIRLNIFAVPLYVMLLLGVEITQLQSATRDIVFHLLNALNFQPSMSDYLISIPISNGTWGATIDWDCTGWKSMLAFFALVMSTPSKTEKKIWGLLAFIPAIFVINVIRIVFMYWYATVDLAHFQIAHALVWSWGLIFAVLALWLVWMKTEPNEKQKGKKGLRSLPI